MVLRPYERIQENEDDAKPWLLGVKYMLPEVNLSYFEKKYIVKGCFNTCIIL